MFVKMNESDFELYNFKINGAKTLHKLSQQNQKYVSLQLRRKNRYLPDLSIRCCHQ